MSRLLITAITTIPLFAFDGCGHHDANKDETAAPIPVTVSKAEKRPVTVSLRSVGNVEATTSVAVVPRVDGQIAKVLVSDGQEVARNQPLFQIDPAPFEIQLRGAQADLARDEAKLENARTKAEHGKMILADHFISPDDYTQLKTDFDSAQATVDADRAARDNAALQLGYATIRAPVAGKLSHIALQVGNTVHASSQGPLTTLNVLDPIDISFAVPEQYVGSLRAALGGGTVEVHASTTDNEQKPLDLVGKLVFIDNSVDTTTGTIRLRARFENRTRALWPGQFVTTMLPLTNDPNSIVVPNAAIQHGPSGAYVFVVKSDSTAEQRAVQVLRTTDADAMVIGVESGETIVTDGQSRLEPGSKVAQRTQQLASDLQK
jgi:membrane fusion protein, multidrug efflux system